MFAIQMLENVCHSNGKSGVFHMFDPSAFPRLNLGALRGNPFGFLVLSSLCSGDALEVCPAKSRCATGIWECPARPIRGCYVVQSTSGASQDIWSSACCCTCDEWHGSHCCMWSSWSLDLWSSERNSHSFWDLCALQEQCPPSRHAAACSSVMHIWLLTFVGKFACAKCNPIISYHILPYPIISYHILSYPIAKCSQTLTRATPSPKLVPTSSNLYTISSSS